MTIQPKPVEFLHSAITLPEFNVFAIDFGGFGIRWYALAYIAGLLIGIYILRRETRPRFTAQNIDADKQPSDIGKRIPTNAKPAKINGKDVEFRKRDGAMEKFNGFRLDCHIVSFGLLAAPQWHLSSKYTSATRFVAINNDCNLTLTALSMIRNISHAKRSRQLPVA